MTRIWTTCGIGSLVLLVSLGASIVPTSRAGAQTITSPWDWPLPPPHRVIRDFVAPPNEYSAGHRGIDISGEAGISVFAPADGRILFAGPVGGRGVITIDHGDGIVSTLEPVTPVVAAHEVVDRGRMIGVLEENAGIDSAGLSSSWHACSCLLLGARRYGRYVSPRILLGNVVPSVLKPWGDGPPRVTPRVTRAGGRARKIL